MAEDFNEGISIGIDWEEVKNKLKVLDGIKKGSVRALNMALNETIKGVKTDAKREMAKRYDMKIKTAAGELTVKKSNFSTLTASVNTKGRPQPLANFFIKEHKTPPKKGTAPAKARVFKRGRRKPIPKAFVGIGKDGRKGIFRRVGADRDKLEQFYGPGASQMLANEISIKEVDKKAKERFDKAFERAVSQVIRKAAEKAMK